MLKHKYIYFVVISSVLTGCLGNQNSSATSTWQVLRTTTPAVTISHLPPANSPVSPTRVNTIIPTRFPSITPSPTNAVKEIQSNCLSISDRLLIGSNYTGTVVLEGWAGDPSYLMNLSSGKISELVKANSFIVSPNHLHLAYKDWRGEYPDYKIVITDATGVKIRVIPWVEEWFLLLQWLDNQRIIIIKNANPIYSTVILNVFTGEQLEIPSNYPDMQKTYEIHNWGDKSFSETVYDPTLTRVLYMDETDIDRAFVLWDIPQKKVLGRYIFDKMYYGFNPQWSPNGDQLAIIADDIEKINQSADEFYLIGRNGQISRLTYLSDQSAYSRIDDYSWSPDGKFIALWWNNDEYEKALQFLLLNTTTGEIVDYCLPNVANGQGSNNGFATAPVWSPDGSKVLLDVIPAEGETRIIVLVDLIKNIAVKIGEGRSPFGWLMTP